MTHTIAEIAAATGLSADGDMDFAVTGVAEPGEAGAGDLALAMSPSYAGALSGGAARAAVLWEGADWRAMGLSAALFAPRARLAMAGLTEHFQHPLDLEPGIHPTAAIDRTARIGEDCWIGPFAVVRAGARIGDGARIGSQAFVGRDVLLGDGAILHPGVRIGARCRIGINFQAHGNAVIGADGFSFVTRARGSVESAKDTGAVADNARNTELLRIHSLAAVEIGDDVEIGACTTIDRGTIAPTRIGSGTKIDNQVQIGHNVQVGRICLICAQVGIAGSARIGDRVVLGGKVGVADHVQIGSDAVCAAGSMVAGKIAPRSVVMGAPAIERGEFLRMTMAQRRLPRWIDRLRQVQDKLGL